MGNLFPPEVEWGIIIAAAVLFPIICFKDLINTYGILGHRCGVAGGPSKVPVEGRNEGVRRLARELMEMGYQPAGVIWETMFLSPVFREYLFVHPDRPGYVTAFNLFGDELLYGRVVVFESGAVLKTMNTDAESVETADYVVKRLGECPVAGLMKSHQINENRFLARGEVPIPCRTVDEIVTANRRAFAHPVERASVVEAGRAGLAAKTSLAGSCAVPGGIGALVFHLLGNGVVTSMMALGAALWVILVSLFFLAVSMTMRWFGTGSGDDEALMRSPILRAVYLGSPVGLVLLVVGAVQLGPKPVAFATLAVTTLIVIAEFTRLVMVNCRKTPVENAQHSTLNAQR